jgi:hypothetical protein
MWGHRMFWPFTRVCGPRTEEEPLVYARPIGKANRRGRGRSSTWRRLRCRTDRPGPPSVAHFARFGADILSRSRVEESRSAAFPTSPRAARHRCSANRREARYGIPRRTPQTSDRPPVRLRRAKAFLLNLCKAPKQATSLHGAHFLGAQAVRFEACGTHSQKALRFLGARSRCRWLRWASLASGPSTVPKIRQAPACTSRKKAAS